VTAPTATRSAPTELAPALGLPDHAAPGVKPNGLPARELQFVLDLRRQDRQIASSAGHAGAVTAPRSSRIIPGECPTADPVADLISNDLIGPGVRCLLGAARPGARTVGEARQ
jgi:hypothetical protein